jgi:hypothetical protein
LLDPECRQNRAAGMILVGDGGERHETIAAELVDRALVAVQLTERELEESIEQGVHCLGADALRERRRVGDVAEQHRGLFALTLQRAARRCHLLRQVGLGVALRRSKRPG